MTVPFGAGKPDVLDFLFQRDAPAVFDAVLELGDDFDEIARGPLAVVVDQVGVIVGDANVARTHTLRARLFEKPRGWNLAFDDHVGGDLADDARRQVGEKEVLEDAAGAFHGGRVFPVADVEDAVRGFAQRGGVAGIHGEVGGKDDPFFVPLENAFAVVEFALGVGEFARRDAVEEVHARDTLRDGVAVGAGVAVDGRAG